MAATSRAADISGLGPTIRSGWSGTVSVLQPIKDLATEEATRERHVLFCFVFSKFETSDSSRQKRKNAKEAKTRERAVMNHTQIRHKYLNAVEKPDDE